MNRRLLALLALAPLAGSPAFEFSLASTGDRPIRSVDYPGRPICLVLWASWSPPSRLLARTLVEIHARPPYERLAFIGVNFESGTPAEQADAARRFAVEHRLPFPVGLGDDAFRKRVRGLKGYPTLLLLDARHRVVGQISGFDESGTRRAELERRLQALVPRDAGN